MSEETPESWFAQVDPELAGAEEAWKGGNAGRGRVCSRRAAGMALKGWLVASPRPGYGTSFMHHLNALADDDSIPIEVREAAARLCARPAPEGGFVAPLPAERLTPMDDARVVVAWARVNAAR
jgi:hypothetical protein